MEMRSKEDALEELLEEVKNLLGELCQSGFDTVHDSTLKGMDEMTELTRQYGLAHLSDMLGELAEGIRLRRHRLKREKDSLAGVYARMNEYLYLCEEKLAYDRAKNYYVNGYGSPERGSGGREAVQP